MRMEILYVGGSIRIPRVIEEAYSTACLLEDGERKILIDPIASGHGERRNEITAGKRFVL